MGNIEQIIKKCTEWFHQKKNNKILNLLSKKNFLKKHNNVELYLLRGKTFYREEKFGDAINDFNKVLEINIKNLEARKYKSNALIALQQYRESIKELAIIIESDNKNPLYFSRRGYCYVMINNLKLALEDYNKAIELDANKSIYHLHRGIVYYKMKNFSKAINDYTRSIELDSKNVFTFELRGQSYISLKEYKLAIEDFNKTIELEPQNYERYSERAKVYQKLELYEEAIMDYGKSIDLFPKNENAFFERSACLHETKKYKDSAIGLTRVIELNPNYGEAYYNRALDYEHLGEFDKAISDYSKALKFFPNDLDIYRNRADVYFILKNYKRALVDISEAIKLSPNDYLSYQFRGRVYGSLGRYKEALKDFNKCIKLNEKDSDSYDLKGITYYNMGENKKAALEFLKGNNYFNFFIKLMKNLRNDDKFNILLICIKIMFEVINKIRSYASEDIKEQVAHYTKLKVADLLVPNNNSYKEKKIRYYNAIYMNDPEEGKILIDCLADENIKKSFEKGGKNEENNIYLGSFLPAPEHQDELVMWRTYGKDENNCEAAGCSIVIDKNFFDDDRELLNIKLMREKNDHDKIKNEPTTQSLYKVIYYDKRNKIFEGKNGKLIESNINQFKEYLNVLIKLKSKTKTSTKNMVIDKIIYHVISEIRYFFKSADYAFESEFRVIQFVDPEKKSILIDELSWPKKLYIESNKSICPHIKKIILGPKVTYPSRWIYLETLMKQNGFKMELEGSTCQYQ